MRIAINTTYLLSENLGGSWTYTSQLVRHLTEIDRGHEFYVLVNESVAEKLPVSNVAGTRVVVKMDFRARAARVAWEQTVLPWMIRRLRVDMVHSGGNTMPLTTREPGVVTVHDLQSLHFPEYFGRVRRTYLRYTIPRSVHRAAAVVTDSHATKKDIVTQLGVPERKVHVISLGGIQEGEVLPESSSDEIVRELGIGRPFFLSVGSSLPHKNLPRLVRAFSRVAHDVKEDLVIVGEGFNQRSSLERTSEETGLVAEGRIRMLGFLPRQSLLGLYLRATAFVFPSLFEGFGIPAVEAMACGCPVIAANATSLPEVVGDAGLLFEPTDESELAQQLVRVSRDQRLRSSMMAKGKERSQLFSWRRMAEETVKVYEEVAFTRSAREREVV